MRAITVVRRPRCFDVIQLRAPLMLPGDVRGDFFGLIAHYNRVRGIPLPDP